MARRAGRVLGRGRHRRGRPRPAGRTGPLRRRSGPGDRGRGGEAGRRSAGHPPSPLSARYDDGRGVHLQGPRGAHADQERHRAARRPHQRGHGGPGCLRRPRRRARPAGRPSAGAGPDRPGGPPGPGPDLRTGPPADGRRARRPCRRATARHRAGHPGGRRPGGTGTHDRRQRRLRRQPVRPGPRGRCRRLPHRGPAPPPGVRVHGVPRPQPPRAARRGTLGHRMALVRAGRRAARPDLRP